MRSHEERFAETKRRIAARQRREQRRRSTITTLSAAVACLVLIVSVSFAMPGMVAGVYCHRAFVLSFGRVRDCSVLPASADKSGGQSG